MYMNIFTSRTECPSCTEKNAKEIFSADLLDPKIRVFLDSKIEDPAIVELFQGTSYTLLQCLNCGLVYQENIFSDQYLSKLYNEWVIHRDETPKAVELFGYYANEFFTISSFFDRPTHEIKVLDYGLGAGKWARVAKALDFDIYGTDLSRDLLDDAKKDGIKTCAIDELGKHKFDFINTEQVFEHLARPRETLLQLIESLAPKGIIKISVPDGANIEKRLPLMDWAAPRHSKRFLMPITPLIHINTFTHEVIHHMGRLLGLSRITPSLSDEYQILDARSAKGFVKSLLRPIYRRWNRPAYVFLQRAATSN
jgi:2-polyprenyl-3-methyl-5-hydroxy-6-metoxy-1,4-benzoquinol methylase